jgi:hypothetical protein
LQLIFPSWAILSTLMHLLMLSLSFLKTQIMCHSYLRQGWILGWLITPWAHVSSYACYMVLRFNNHLLCFGYLYL